VAGSLSDHCVPGAALSYWWGQMSVRSGCHDIRSVGPGCVLGLGWQGVGPGWHVMGLKLVQRVAHIDMIYR
jgi:hypothetical protein